MRRHLSTLSAIGIAMACLAAGPLPGADRATIVRDDLQRFLREGRWIYGDLASGLRRAGETGAVRCRIRSCFRSRCRRSSASRWTLAGGRRSSG